MLATNAIGTEKLKPIVIGKSIQPRALAHLNYDALPVTYRANANAWMRSDIFGEWLKKLDRKFRLEDRHILLLIDNASSHYNPNENNNQESDKSSDEESDSENSNNEENYKSIPITRRGCPRLSASNINRQGRQDSLRGKGLSNKQGSSRVKVADRSKGRYGSGRTHSIADLSNIYLTNIQIEFLPPNITAHLQPMDARIINSFKTKYKRKYIRHIMDQFEKSEDINK
jgi:DDE superfamily endonuclease